MRKAAAQAAKAFESHATRPLAYTLVSDIERSGTRMENVDSVLEYVYRDAGNFKTFGRIRLEGAVGDAKQTIRDCLEWGDQFVAEQVGVPSICRAHWEAVGEGPSDLDHAYHEFFSLRALCDEDRDLPVWGSLETLVLRMQRAARNWDVRLSPNVDL